MQFRHNEDHPLDAQAIVVDEASMLDLFLAHSFVKAIPPEAQLLIVGDIDQLPSVGPGMVLRDLIASEQLPVVRLTEVFRQAAESHGGAVEALNARDGGGMVRVRFSSPA